MNLVEIATLLGCAKPKNISITNVSIDSRKIPSDAIFIALKGNNFDGHDFIKSAVANGAVAVICEKMDPTIAVPQLQVADSVEALGVVAHYHRQTLSCPIIAVTGSNGKTTVKEMIAAILPQPALATAGNFNNHIGAPLSVLQLNETHQFAVFELGANHVGEIKYTATIVQPDVAIINNIGPAHIEGFGSIENVAKAKGEIYQGLAAHGTAVINDDDEYAHFWDDIVADKKQLRFSKHKPCDVHAKNIVLNEQGCASFSMVFPDKTETPIALKIPGEHSVSNALAAAAACFAIGLDTLHIAMQLENFNGVAGRMAFFAGKHAATIIDDTYNANLNSVLAAIKVLAERQGQKILVLGDLAELGSWAQLHHETIGTSARQHGIDYLFTYGDHSFHSGISFGINTKHYNNQNDLARDLLPYLNQDCTVLVKGSRSAAMENVVQQLLQ